MERWTGKIAFVTGASSGIGAAIACELVKQGMKVVGIARRMARLEQIKKQIETNGSDGQFYPFQCDLTNESDILAAFKWTNDNFGGVDVLVNSAGLARKSNLTEGLTNDWKTVLDVNVVALCICTREAVKSMKSRDCNGHIIHINSIVGHQVPQLAANIQNLYSASKFAVRALAETLNLELRTQQNRKIKVTNLSPGYVSNTEFVEVNNLQEELNPILQHIPSLDPKDIADSVIYVLSTPPNVNITELTLIGL